MAAGLGPAREVRFLIPGESSRSADVLLPHWVGGKDAALDITVVNSFQVATVVGAATEAGHALTHAFNRKMRGTAEACHRQAVAFMPLVVESYGGWHEMGVRGGEAGGGTGPPVRAGGGGGDETHVGEAGNPPPAWQCCHLGQPCAFFPCSGH